MSPRWLFRLVAPLLLLAVAAPVRGQSFGFPWWKDAQFQHDLALTADQTAKIDAVFQSTISVLRQKKEELDRHEDDLAATVRWYVENESWWRPITESEDYQTFVRSYYGRFLGEDL